MAFDSTQPYDDLPLLPPATEIESKGVLRQTVLAARALGELKQAGRHIPNESVLVNSIPLLEAQVSSEIENIVTTSDKLFRLAAHDPTAADPATKEAYRYRTALYKGFGQLSKRPLDREAAIDICSTIRNVAVEIRSGPGTTIGNPATGQVVYTPPADRKRLDLLLSNWESYAVQKDAVDPLVKLAVLHYQFEAIHPFTDGNGRTGRILNILYLVQCGLLRTPVLYLSRYILQHRLEYYRFLREVTENQRWEPWILFVLFAVEETARWTSARINAIYALHQHTRRHIRERLPGIYSRELVDVLFIQPYVRIEVLVEAGIGQRQTAASYLKRLVDAGVLQELKVGREKLFLHTKFFDLLRQESEEFLPYGEG